MTRSKQFLKLGNAIRRYRGVTIQRTVGIAPEWKYPPQKAALEDVLGWLRSLGIPDSELYVIQRFQSFDDMRNWMQAQQEVTR